MPHFSKSGDQWVVLDDKKNVLYSDPDRAKALAFFKTIGTKPENTCPHPKVRPHVRLEGQPPEVAMVPYKTWTAIDPATKTRLPFTSPGGMYAWEITRHDFKWIGYYQCVTCQKEVDHEAYDRAYERLKAKDATTFEGATKNDVVDSPSDAV